MISIANAFENHKIIVYADAVTHTLYDSWRSESNYNIEIIKEEYYHHSRTVRIYYGRDKLVSSANNTSQYYAYPSFLFVLDLDDVNIKPFDMRVFNTVMSRTDEWDALSFNRAEYYDIWSLRYSRFNINIWEFGSKSSLLRDIITADIASSLDTSDPHGTFYPVISAFNGVGLYKMSIIGDCRYVGTNTHTYPIRTLYNMSRTAIYEDCEHVAFHKCISNNGGRVSIFTLPLVPS
jgi:hypothetical protein